MQRKLLFLCLSIFILFPGKSALPQCDEWELKHPKPVNLKLFDVHCFDQDSAIMVGRKGLVLRTASGGTAWDSTYYYCGPSFPLFRFTSFPNDSIGWIAGAGGILMKSTDGGKNFSPQGDVSNKNLEDFFFADSLHGWAIGLDTLVMTNDGGSTWSTAYVNNSEWMQDIHFPNDSMGWIALTQGKLLHSSDGGNSWNYQDPSTTESFNSVHFINDSVGWAAGDNGILFRTSDGGTNWDQLSVSMSGYLDKLHFVNDSMGWLTETYNDKVFYTTDSGDTWGSTQVVQYEDIEGIHFADTANGWAVGDYRVLSKTNDGGSSWGQQLVSNRKHEVTRVQAKGDGNVWATADSGDFMHSVDTGNSWGLHSTPSNTYFEDFLFIDPSTVWALSYSPGGLVHSADSGNSWVDQGSYNGPSIFFIDSTHGWLAHGNSNDVYRTEDGGNSWTAVTVPVSYDIYAVHFFDHANGWAVGEEGVVARTQDSGKTWIDEGRPVLSDLYDVQMLDSGVVVAVGANNTILRKSPGSSWNELTYSYAFALRDVYFPRNKVGWVASSGGIYYSLDSGKTWQEETIHLGTDLYSVHSAEGDGLWVSGSQSTVLHRPCSPDSASISDTVCGSYSAPSGTIYDSSGVHEDTILTRWGCDSLLTIDLTIKEPSYDSLSETACYSYTSPSGAYTWDSSGTYSDTLSNNVGCDSVLTIDLKIPDFDTSVVLSGDSLIAQDSGVTHQWLDCEGSINPITGANSRVYEPDSNGVYAVVLSDSGCSDTSSCQAFNALGMKGEGKASKWSVSPNPSRGQVQIELAEHTKGVSLTLMDLKGRKLRSRKGLEGRRFTLDWEGENGVYFLKVKARGQEKVFRLVKSGE